MGVRCAQDHTLKQVISISRLLYCKECMTRLSLDRVFQTPTSHRECTCHANSQSCIITCGVVRGLGSAVAASAALEDPERLMHLDFEQHARKMRRMRMMPLNLPVDADAQLVSEFASSGLQFRHPAACPLPVDALYVH